MELKRYIESVAKVIAPSIDHLQLMEHSDKELDFAYGMQENHTSFKRMIKQIIIIIFR